MPVKPSGRFSFDSLNREIRSYLSDVATEKSVTRALRKIQAAERKIARITGDITRASLGRAAKAGFEIRDGIVREPAPSAAPDRPLDDTQALLSDSSDELQQARNIQAKLLPAEVPDLPGLDVASYSRFCHDVGGDYFDFIPLTGGRYALVVADVSGKGVPAAMVMVMFRSILRMVAANNHTAVDTLAHTNRLVQRDLLRGMFISAIYAEIDPAARRLALVNAGHTPPLIARRSLSGTRAIRIRGPAIGLLPGDRFSESLRQKTLALQSGDCLCFYTDGVNEAKDLLGEELGHQALARAFRGAGERPAADTVKALVAAIEEHQEETPQHDDITLVVLRAL